jgi:putative FmdB family regulatory protein
MPLYEFVCPKCNHLHEEWFKIKDSPKKLPCKKCNGIMKRIISNTSFILKGTGWYQTDYKNKNTHSKKDPKKDK